MRKARGFWVAIEHVAGREEAAVIAEAFSLQYIECPE
jgi:hypothetical protein